MVCGTTCLSSAPDGIMKHGRMEAHMPALANGACARVPSLKIACYVCQRCPAQQQIVSRSSVLNLSIRVRELRLAELDN